MNSTIKIAFTYVGAVVGAGFASGKELMKFFAVFGEKGLYGAITAGILFSLAGGIIIREVQNKEINNYGQLLTKLFSKKLSKMLDVLISITLFTGMGVMMQGSSTLLEQELHLNINYAFIITGILIFICLKKGNQGLLNSNVYLVPFLIIISLATSLIVITSPVICNLQDISIDGIIPNWWMGSLLYVGFNMILGIVVLSSVQEENERISAWGGIIGGIILGIMLFLLVKSLVKTPNITFEDMPLLALTKRINPLTGRVYSISMWLAMFTTALANTFSLTVRFYKRINYHKMLIIVLLSSIIYLPFRFSFLVSTTYPLLGYIGFPLSILVIGAILVQKIKIYK